MSNFNPDNLPINTPQSSGSGVSVAEFIPTVTKPALITDMPGSEGYIESPAGFTNVFSNGLSTFPTNDRMSFSPGGETTLNHELTISYKLTNVGSDSDINELPIGGTTIQATLVDGFDTILQTSGGNPVNLISSRKHDNGKHDIIILKGLINTNDGDIARIKFFVTDPARISIFGISWRVSTL